MTKLLSTTSLASYADQSACFMAALPLTLHVCVGTSRPGRSDRGRFFVQSVAAVDTDSETRQFGR